MSLKLLSGHGHLNLAHLVERKIGYPTGIDTLQRTDFSNGEMLVTVKDSVRDEDVYILSTAAAPVNDNLMELLIAINTCKIASARKITAVLPCFPYARQNKKDRPRAAVTAKLVANLIEVAGCDHVITIDLHASQIQGLFDNIPVVNYDRLPHLSLTDAVLTLAALLSTEGAILEYIRLNFDLAEIVIVSPVAGSTKRAASISERLQVPLSLTHDSTIIGDVTSKTCILLDNIADTCETIYHASSVLLSCGASRCVAVVTHGLFGGNAIDLIEQSGLEKLAIANTLPLSERARACEKVETIDVSGLVAEAIRRTHNGESISQLFV